MVECSGKARSVVERKLEALRKNDGLPSALIEFVAQVIQLQEEATNTVVLPELLEERMSSLEKRLMGAALLPRDEFEVDMGNARMLYDSLLQLAQHTGGTLQENAGLLASAEASGDFSREAAFFEFITGRRELFETMAARVPSTPKLFDFLVSASLSPSLETCSVVLAERIDRKKSWNYGHCPVCGSLPLMARLEGKEGFRMLTCSFCHHEYRAKRLQCPYCLEEDMNKLHYFTAESDSGFQVHVCDSCHSYIKSSDFRNLDRVSYPLLDDLESLALDVAADKEGFSRPTSSAWGF